MQIISKQTRCHYPNEPSNPHKHLRNSLTDDFEYTKQHIFPDKYLYKHNWLKQHSTSTYKREFKPKNTSISDSNCSHTHNISQHNLIHKIYSGNQTSFY